MSGGTCSCCVKPSPCDLKGSKEHLRQIRNSLNFCRKCIVNQFFPQQTLEFILNFAEITILSRSSRYHCSHCPNY